MSKKSEAEEHRDERIEKTGQLTLDSNKNHTKMAR